MILHLRQLASSICQLLAVEGFFKIPHTIRGIMAAHITRELRVRNLAIKLFPIERSAKMNYRSCTFLCMFAICESFNGVSDVLLGINAHS